MNELLIETAFHLYGKLVYKKLKDRYRIFCMKCMRYEYVTKEQLKQIQAAQICPMCFQKVTPSKKLEHGFHYYIMDYENDGYRVSVNWKFGQKPKTELIQVMYDALDGTNIFTRFIFCNMGYGFCWRDDMKEWKKRNAQGYFWRFNSVHEDPPITKKDYIYKALWDRGVRDTDADMMVKSNQKKIFIDNLMSGSQMEFTVAFDLKSYEEVYKYRAYMKKNSADIFRPLNIHYLDYVVRNNIKLHDFYDYMRQCDQLGVKVDKPRDFIERHHKYSQIIANKRKEDTEKKIKKRYAQLLKMAYAKDGVEIVPFKTGDEIRKCGKKLHNCIASIYLPEYANHSTDLYCLKKNGAMLVAIEVRNNRVVQARSNWNKDCPAVYMKHIKKWCNTNRFALASSL